MDGWPRYIIHVDMDAFYAAVEQRDNPELLGKPVIIGGPPNSRGVVSTASYEARKFGVHSAMPTAEAYRLCPQGIFLPGNHQKYRAVSQAILAIYQNYTPQIEPLALDEAFLDVTASRKLFGDAVSIGRAIKARIQAEIGLTASVGVSYNKYLAKLGSDLKKPDGFVVISPQETLRLLDPLPVKRLWGVGPKTAAQLQALGLKTIGQVRRVSLDILEKKFGVMAKQIYQLSRGIDHRVVEPQQQPKSIGNETTFAGDLLPQQVLPHLLELVLEVGRRLRKQQLEGRTVTLKLRYANFTTITRSHTFEESVSSDQEIYQAVKRLFEANYPTDKIRLAGVTLSNLCGQGQGQSSLFGNPGKEKQDKLNTVIDQLYDRFGAGSITRGTLVEHERDEFK